MLNNRLSQRELQVLELTAKGLTNDQIALTIGISFSTAKGHMNNVLGKLGARSRAEAIALAVRDGLINLNPHNPMQLGKRIQGIELPQKYRLLEDFVLEMVHRMEEAEAKYGDWRDIDKPSIRNHLMDEYRELREAGFEDAKESVDLANLCFMNWALVNNYITPLNEMRQAKRIE